MTIPSQHYAELSDLGYKPPVIKNIKENGNIKYWPMEIDGSDYEPLEYRNNPVTGYQGTIYQRKDTGELIVIHRGTEFDKLPGMEGRRDVGVDIAMAVARINAQAPGAIALTQRALELAEKHGVDGKPVPEVTVAGHSLGGNLSQICAHKFHLRGETFNSYGAASLSHGVPEGGYTVINHVMAADFVSAASPHFGQVRIYATPEEITRLRQPFMTNVESHRMHHFTREDGDRKPDRSVLDDPQALALAAQHAPFIGRYRAEIRMARALVSGAGDGIRTSGERRLATTEAHAELGRQLLEGTMAAADLARDAMQPMGEHRLREAQQNLQMGRQLRQGMAEAAGHATEHGRQALSAAGQAQLRQAEQQLEVGRRVQQGFAQFADYLGQKAQEAAEYGREVLERSAAAPSPYLQGKIGTRPGTHQGEATAAPAPAQDAPAQDAPAHAAPPPAAPGHSAGALQHGDHGQDVAQLQSRLIELGHHRHIHLPLHVNGVYDSATEQAVMCFQLKHGSADINGIADAGIRDALQQALPLIQQPQWQQAAERQATAAPAYDQAPSLLPYSDARHPEHALYADTHQRLQAQGHQFTEERLNQIAAQLHIAGFSPGWKGDMSVSAGTLHAVDHQSLWDGRLQLALTGQAPLIQASMEAAQQHDQSLASLQQSAQQQRGQSPGMVMG